MKLVSPVFGKELITLARGKRHYFARALLLTALLVVVAITWRGSAGRYAYRGFMDTSWLGHSLFLAFTITQLIAVVVIVPALTAPVIAAEKDQQTLSLLLMSNLRPHHILLDKLLSRILLMVLLLLSGVPLFLALLALGGIEPRQILSAYGGILSVLLFCSGVGLFFSTLLNRMHTALMATYATLIGYVFGLIVLHEVDGVHINEQCFLPTPDGTASLNESVTFFLICASVFVMGLAFSRLLLGRAPERKRASALKRLIQGIGDLFLRINFTGVEVMNENRVPQRHAMMWKETHKHFYSSNTFLIRATYLLLIGSVVLYLRSRDKEAFFGVLSIGGTILIGMIGTVAAAAAFTTEKERRSFEVLMSSPLTARAVVLAKFAGVLKLTVPILICLAVWLPIGHIAPRYAGGTSAWLRDGAAAYFLLAVAAHLPLLVVIGLFASVRRRKTATALLQTFLCILLWCLGPLIVFLYEAFGRANFPSYLLNFVACVNPVSVVPFALFDPGDFSPLACVALIPCWIILLAILIREFDGMVGRQ